MPKLFLAGLFTVGFFISVKAQSGFDSLQIKNANWHKERVARRVVWQEAHFDSLFGSKQNVNLIVLKNRRRRPVVALASAGDSLRPTS